MCDSDFELISCIALLRTPSFPVLFFPLTYLYNYIGFFYFPLGKTLSALVREVFFLRPRR